ncbi:aKG-HExxH-type peptide beta-hydroxylase [Nonomuraea sp. NPDC004297]
MSSLVSLTAAFDPVPIADDPWAIQFAELRRTGLRRFAGLLRARLSADDVRALELSLRLSEELSAEEWTALATHPHYGYWWNRLSQAIARGDAPEVSLLVDELARLLLPFVPRDRLDGVSLRLPPAADGVLRFPTHGTTLRTAGLDAGERWHADVEGTTAKITGGTGACEVDLARLFHPDRPALPGVRRSTRIPGTGIDVDATDPWVTEFIAAENVNRPSPGRTADDMTPCEISQAGLRELGTAVAGITSSWPDMGRELSDYVRLVVPFDSRVRAAFTNVAWHGAVFLRAGVHDVTADVERLVHETSHLRLNLVMTLAKLHTHAPDERIPSPFRAGPRPVSGLYHGAFVVTRAAMALDRHHAVHGGPDVTQRVPVLLAQVTGALDLLRTRVDLTPAGAALLDEVEGHVAALATRYGLADSCDPTIYEEL